MEGKQIGYIRVSSTDQNIARQLDGFHLDKIFTDRCSGKDTSRPQLVACLDYLRDGDTLHVHSIDRLARNLQDLLRIIESLNQRDVSVSTRKDSPFPQAKRKTPSRSSSSKSSAQSPSLNEP